MSDSDEDTGVRDAAPFTPLADYCVPATPTRDSLQTWLTRARELFRRKPPAPMITDDRLRRSTLDMLDDVASPPACGPLLAEIDASLADWLAEETPARRKRLFVLPPGDRNHIVAAWAETAGHARLTPPPRSELLTPGGAPLPDVRGDGLLVIPALEDWFVRHTHGLDTLRQLLDTLDRLDRHVLIGCNSWAWQYLSRAVAADAVLGPAETFQAFDAHRLRAWFNEISQGAEHGPVCFRDARSGDDIMALDAQDEPHEMLISLAARSRGIPWVAWRLWRRSLRRRIDPEDDAHDAPAAVSDADEQTLWVIALEEFSLPGADNDDTLFLLHALLIHGALTPDLLRAVLPITQAMQRLPALVAAGIVTRHEDGRLACAPAAYPAIRAGLTTAGFPIAAL
ncbi:hypothetical protein [Salinisphaera sp. Q1T1-3]|uniref:hypothetical protein n=1 Tax=Salinisphaera sp. Q1T1-3 TaxID=2321229 RepID=UPI0011C478E9|nr:hypothetical protein [Salinisphaera sp. Q1T1-3]